MPTVDHNLGVREKEGYWGQQEVGYKYRTQECYVTETDLDNYSTVTGMRDPSYLDDDAAKAAGRKGRTLPPGMLLGLHYGLLYNLGTIRGSIWIGVTDLKFVNTAHPKDTLHMEGELLEKKLTSKGDRFVITYSWIMMNQRGDVIVDSRNICMTPNPEVAGEVSEY
jgi:acyl dehydratase